MIQISNPQRIIFVLKNKLHQDLYNFALSPQFPSILFYEYIDDLNDENLNEGDILIIWHEQQSNPDMVLIEKLSLKYNLRVLVLFTHDSLLQNANMLYNRGVNSVVSISDSFAEFTNCLNRIIAFADNFSSNYTSRKSKPTSGKVRITANEAFVLNQLILGIEPKLIAISMGIVAASVYSYINKLKVKFNVTGNMTNLILTATVNGYEIK
jgi:DNA-binding CsgD family transcriptional regulator